MFWQPCIIIFLSFKRILISAVLKKVANLAVHYRSNCEFWYLSEVYQFINWRWINLIVHEISKKLSVVFMILKNFYFICLYYILIFFQYISGYFQEITILFYSLAFKFNFNIIQDFFTETNLITTRVDAYTVNVRIFQALGHLVICVSCCIDCPSPSNKWILYVWLNIYGFLMKIRHLLFIMLCTA